VLGRWTRSLRKRQGGSCSNHSTVSQPSPTPTKWLAPGYPTSADTRNPSEPRLPRLIPIVVHHGAGAWRVTYVGHATGAVASAAPSEVTPMSSRFLGVMAWGMSCVWTA
jgi:hypothetical protein